MKINQFGRSLLETLSVLVVMALLVMGSVVGYNVVMRKYRENETVKQVSELSVKYKLNPVKTDEKFVKIKDVYPEAERADAMTIRTADTAEGRISLQVFDGTTSSSFAIVVDKVLDDSCRAILEKSEYALELLKTYAFACNNQILAKESIMEKSKELIAKGSISEQVLFK